MFALSRPDHIHVPAFTARLRQTSSHARISARKSSAVAGGEDTATQAAAGRMSVQILAIQQCVGEDRRQRPQTGGCQRSSSQSAGASAKTGGRGRSGKDDSSDSRNPAVRRRGRGDRGRRRGDVSSALRNPLARRRRHGGRGRGRGGVSSALRNPPARRRRLGGRGRRRSSSGRSAT